MNDIGWLLWTLLTIPFTFLESIVPVGWFLNISWFEWSAIWVSQSILLYILSGCFWMVFLILLFSILNRPINYGKGGWFGDNWKFEWITPIGLFGKILTWKITSIMFVNLLWTNLSKLFTRVMIFVFALAVLYAPFDMNGTPVNTLKNFHNTNNANINTSLNLMKSNFIKIETVWLQKNSPLVLENCESSQNVKVCMEENDVKWSVFSKIHWNLQLLLVKSNNELVEILPKYKTILEDAQKKDELSKDIEGIKNLESTWTWNTLLIEKYSLPKIDEGMTEYSQKEKLKIANTLSALVKSNIQSEIQYFQELSIINSILNKWEKTKELLQTESNNFIKKYNEKLNKQRILWDDMKLMYQWKMICEGTGKTEWVSENKWALDLLFWEYPCVTSYDKFLFSIWYLFHSFIFLLMISMMWFRGLYLIFLSLYVKLMMKNKGNESVSELYFPSWVDGLKEEYEMFNKDMWRYMLFLIFEILIKVMLVVYVFNWIFWN